jgi:glycosyltransferase involved in cell wall biosynthesis
MSRVLRRFGISQEMFLWVKKIIKNNKITIIHVHSLWMLPNIYPRWLLKNSSKVYSVISPRGTLSNYAMNRNYLLKKIIWTLLQKKVLEDSSCIHATAYSEYGDIRKLGFRNPVCIIPNGIDLPNIDNYSKSKRLNRLLFLGRLHPKKGLLNLVKAWARLEALYPEWELVIVGPDNGGHSKDLIDLIEKLSLKRVLIMPPVFGDEKFKILSESDIFVMPTFSENFGMTVAEALASGTPVIATKGAPWEGLEENSCGWWIDIGINPLVNAMREGMDLGSDELQLMGQLGRAWMDRDYSWDAIGEEMGRVYRWISSGGPRPKSVMLV